MSQINKNRIPQVKERKLINKNEFVVLAAKVKEIFEEEEKFLQEDKNNENSPSSRFLSLS